MTTHDERYMLINPDGTQYGPADSETLRLWAQDGRVAVGARLRPVVGGVEIAVAAHPALAPLLSAPPAAGVAPPLPNAPPPGRDDVLSSVIPTRNPAALIGYYLGIFGLIPCLGPPLALAAVVCGIIGLLKVRESPEAKGTVHAYVAIVLGSLSVIGHLAVVLLMQYI